MEFPAQQQDAEGRCFHTLVNCIGVTKVSMAVCWQIIVVGSTLAVLYPGMLCCAVLGVRTSR